MPAYENTYLENGQSNAKVTQMQSRLIELGYLEGSASGKFCDITEYFSISKHFYIEPHATSDHCLFRKL